MISNSETNETKADPKNAPVEAGDEPIAVKESSISSSPNLKKRTEQVELESSAVQGVDLDNQDQLMMNNEVTPAKQKVPTRLLGLLTGTNGKSKDSKAQEGEGLDSSETAEVETKADLPSAEDFFAKAPPLKSAGKPKLSSQKPKTLEVVEEGVLKNSSLMNNSKGETLPAEDVVVEVPKQRKAQKQPPVQPQAVSESGNTRDVLSSKELKSNGEVKQTNSKTSSNELPTHNEPSAEDQMDSQIQPVRSTPEDDRPLKSKGGGYDFDNLDSIPDTYVPSSSAKRQTGQKKAATPQVAEDDGKKVPKASEDLPIKAAPPASEDRPIKAAPPASEDLPIKAAPPASEDRPIKAAPTTNSLDEKPIGSKTGGYDLDNMDNIMDTYKPSGKAAAKRPVAPKETVTAPERVESEKPVPTISNDEDRPLQTSEIPKPFGNDDIPIGGGAKPKDPFSEENAFLSGGAGGETNPDDNAGEETLEGRIRSSKFQTRMSAYEELLSWSDSEYTPAVFVKSLHLTIKDKHPVALDKLLTAMESLIEKHTEAFKQLDLSKFFPNFCEHLLCNVKGASKDHAIGFIVTLWNACGKPEFLAQIKESFTSKKKKPQIEEKTLLIILELLKAGKIEEMKYLSDLWPEIAKYPTNRTMSIKTLAMDIYKEAFLWMGEGLKMFLKEFKKPQMDELEAYFKTIDPSKMKSVKKAEGSKAKSFDAYDIVAEFELPKPFNDDSWVDEVLSCAKWNEKKEQLDRLITLLEKNPKLSPKTNGFMFIALAKKLFMENNMVVQMTMIKLLGLLSAGLRKNFANPSKTILPVLLGKLKEKNKGLTDEILSTLEKFYITLTFEDTMDDIREHMEEKNSDKKSNMLKLLILLATKLERIKTDKHAVAAVKLVIKLTDENDVGVRDLASQLIAKLKDNFNDKVTPLLSDLNSQKMSKILKYSQNTSAVVAAPTAEADKPAKKAEAGGEGGAASAGLANKSKVIKDKSQVIADMREALFSNKTVRLSDVKNFSTFLFTNLKQLMDMTKEFKEVSTTQTKEICLLAEEITGKVDKAAYPEDSRKIIALFYIEQLMTRTTDELILSVENYANCSTRLVTPKLFLQDVFDLLAKRSMKISKDLLVLILRLYDREIAANNTLSQLPHKLFVDFLKSNFSSQAIHASYKTPLLGTMRSISKKFGEKALSDFPPTLIKELDSINTEAQKAFAKTLEKLTDKNPEKKRQALAELANHDDPAKLLLFWSNNDFLNFIKRMLMMEKGANYSALLSIVSSYLILHTESPSDFSIRSFIFVFHGLLTQFFDQRDSARSAELDTLIRKAVTAIGASNMLLEMINDTAAPNWKEQILHFYTRYATEIEPSLRFINYISTLIGPKGPSNELRPLLETALLALKHTHNDEVIIRGNENKFIREIWQKDDEELIINETFIKGVRVFEEPAAMLIVKNFLMESFKLDEAAWSSRNLEAIPIGDAGTSSKLVLALFYIRSVENLPRVISFIAQYLSTLDATSLDQLALLIALKTTLNLLKNMAYASQDPLFADLVEIYSQFLRHLPISIDEFYNIAEMTDAEINFAESVASGEGLPAYAPNERGTSAQPLRNIANTISDLSAPGPSPMQGRGETTRTVSNNGIADRRRPSRISDMQTPEDDLPPVRNTRDMPVASVAQMPVRPVSPRSQLSSMDRPSPTPVPAKGARNGTAGLSNTRSGNQFAEPAFDEAALERPAVLQEKFRKMLTFDMVEFEDASEYFKQLCRSTSPSSAQFLCNYASDILTVFVEVSAKVFEQGINYDLERSSYELIFVPLQQICSVEGLLGSLQQASLNVFVEHILQRLVLSNDEKVYMEQQNEEAAVVELAAFMVRFWNSIMLRVIELSEVNALLIALFTIIIETRNYETDKLSQAIYSLAFKCIIRITRNLKNIIDKVDPKTVITVIFNYIQAFGVRASDSVDSKSIKTLLNELVSRSDPSYIWACYQELFGDQGEPHISKWIQIIQEKSNRSISSAAPVESDRELIMLIREAAGYPLGQLHNFIDDFERVLEASPGLDLRSYVSLFPSPQYVEFLLQEMQNSRRQTPLSSYNSQRIHNIQQTPIPANRRPGGNNGRHMNEFLNRTEMTEGDPSRNLPRTRQR
jgi:hypothetical protein